MQVMDTSDPKYISEIESLSSGKESEEDVNYEHDADDEDETGDGDDNAYAEEKASLGPRPPTNLSGKFCLLFCILSVEMSQRLTGITATLVFYLKNGLHLHSPIPTTITLALNGASFFTPVLGGWIADTFLGRYKTTLGSAIVFFLGTSLLAAMTYDYGPGHDISLAVKEGVLCVALVLVAIGNGGIKSNVSPLGADQIEHEGQETIARFFNWFYWLLQASTLFAYTVVVYLQQEVSFFSAYLVGPISIFGAILFFLGGRKHYLVHPPRGSALSDTFRITWNGVKKTLQRGANNNHGHYLDKAKVSAGGEFPDVQVDDVKSLLRLLPILFTFTLFGTAFSQVITTFPIQGFYMKLKLSSSFTMPAASLSVIQIISVMIFIPFIDRVVHPILRHFGINFSPLRRIGVGLLFTAASVIVGAVVEIERKKVINELGYFRQKVFGTFVNASPMNVFHQTPQYVLLGCAEALVLAAGYEFAYSQAPPSLRSVVMGLNLTMNGIGSFMASGLTSAVKVASKGVWYPQDFNQGLLENYLFLLAGLTMLNLLLFVVLSSKYEYVMASSYEGYRALQSEDVERDPSH